MFTLHLTDGDDTFDIVTDDLEITLYDEQGLQIGEDAHDLDYISGGPGEDTITTDINTLILSNEGDGIDAYTILVNQQGLDAFQPVDFGNPIELLHFGHTDLIQSPGFEDSVTVDLSDDIEGFVHQVNYTVSFPQPTNMANEGSAFVGVVVTDTLTPPDTPSADYLINEAILLHYWTFDAYETFEWSDDGEAINWETVVNERQLASLTFTGRPFDSIEPLELPYTGL